MSALRAAVAALSIMPAALSQYSRGVNLSGAEFGQAHLPGQYNTDYTFQSENSFRYFSGRNLDLIRFPIQWERIQPTLHGPLDSSYLALLRRSIAWSKAHDCKLVIEIHNFGRYSFNENGRLNTYVIDNPVGGMVRVTTADLADFWLRMSVEFRDDDGVYAYDIMNEPHDMGPASWKNISQATLNAIRSNGDRKLVMIPGDSWSSANRWMSTHGPQAWITDPANNFLYEAHEYFDSDESGTYTMSYDEELRRNANLANIGLSRLAPFEAWCRNNNVGGYLGEYGIPNNDLRWLTVLENFLNALDRMGFNGTYWAAGEWWGNYPLSIQPQGNFNIDRVQMPVLSAHLAPGAFTSVSAASYSGAIVAPDSLASGFVAPAAGMNLSSASEIDVVDGAGLVTVAVPLFASATQINYVIPSGLAPGHYRVAVKSAGNLLAQGNLELDLVSPTLFTANASGSGMAAAQVVRVHPDGSQSLEDIRGPIDFGDASERLFVVLYGTGFRKLARGSLRVGGTDLAIAYAGAQGAFAGLDQLNAELPRSLAGRGEAAVAFSADGKPANAVTLSFR